jgi:ribonuclease T2
MLLLVTKPRYPFALLAVLVFAVACSSHPTGARPPADPTGQTAATPAATADELPGARATRATTPAFDFFLLNLSWSPEYCESHASAAECKAHSTFVLHGLWPENADGTYKTKCSTAPGPANPSQYKDIYPGLSLLQHEWSTHGTCSGLGPDAFFMASRTAFHSIVIPPKLAQLSSEISMKPADILTLFTASNSNVPLSSLAMTCSGNQLTAVEVCLDKSLHPTSCGPIKSCRASSVAIPAP